ncbi:hypothetical protein [Ornithinimicrobium pratense]|uniref:Uncharacterized protein n=1 Tax=Ornithinimicrobium pratense TaxID=2593973 RepID=A0A5J6V4W4_9MICO|nr:hypothetical protein [Ornithinimicrobium pratense]QFG68808.1 hypothetical protein FY030_08905 [Ornithinimicrobium pratense]
MKGGPQDEHQDERPVTGDPGVDRITADLQQAMGEDPEQVVTALTEAHRRLQARLSDPGPTPPQ